MSFDQKLKALRLENKMTQEYVARKLNVARSTIAGYETKSRQPSHEKLASLANLFHVSVDYLLDNQTGQEIMVVFSSGQTACTLAVDLDDFDFVPKANFMCKIVFLCVATDTWLVDAKEG